MQRSRRVDGAQASEAMGRLWPWYKEYFYTGAVDHLTASDAARSPQHAPKVLEEQKEWMRRLHVVHDPAMIFLRDPTAANPFVAPELRNYLEPRLIPLLRKLADVDVTYLSLFWDYSHDPVFYAIRRFSRM
jgi:hypothetical protein